MTGSPTTSTTGPTSRGGAPANSAGIMLNLGCGRRWNGAWKNLDGGPLARLHWLRSIPVVDRLVPGTIRAYPRDLIVWDLRRVPLPFADGSASVIFSQYVLEYLTPQEALRTLKDCRRALIPGGLIRLCQADIGAIVGFYLGQTNGATGSWAIERAKRFLEYAAGEHTKLSVRLLRRGGVQQLFDRPSLQWMLDEAGFTDIRFRRMHEGECPDLQELEAEWECPLIRVEARTPVGDSDRR